MSEAVCKGCVHTEDASRNTNGVATSVHDVQGFSDELRGGNSLDSWERGMAALVKRDSHGQRCDLTLQSWEPSASPTPPDADARQSNVSDTLQENTTKNGPDFGLSVATEPSPSLSTPLLRPYPMIPPPQVHRP